MRICFLLCLSFTCAIMSAISPGAFAQTQADNHLGINGIHFTPSAIFGNLTGTTISTATDLHPTPTESYVNENKVVLTETGIDHPAVCQASPGVCSSDGGSLFESNAHAFFFSADAGTTPYDFQEENAFDISFDMKVETTNPLNRKGIGFHIDSDPGGSNVKTQFTAQTTNNLFGGAAPGQIGVSSSSILPLHSFSDFNGITYTAGDSLRVQIIYIPPERNTGGTLTTRGTLEYRVDTDIENPGGEFSSGVKEILTQTVNSKSIDGGLLAGTHLGFRAQVVADNIGEDDYVVTYSNFAILDPTDNADFDLDEDVDGADFLTWQRGEGLMGTAERTDGDYDGDLNVDAGDLAGWLDQYGTASPETPSAIASVPEPATGLLATSLFLTLLSASRKHDRVLAARL